MAPDFITGLPLHRVASMRKEQIEQLEEIEAEQDMITDQNESLFD